MRERGASDVRLCFFSFHRFLSLSLSFFLVLLVHVSSLSVNVYNLFCPFGLLSPYFVLSFLACSSVAIQECLAFYTCSPCFFSLVIVPTFPLNNIWLFDVRLIFEHPFCPIPCYVAKSVMICLLHKLICPFVYFYSYLYLVLSSFYST